jgi:hypothetical protein
LIVLWRSSPETFDVGGKSTTVTAVNGIVLAGTDRTGSLCL